LGVCFQTANLQETHRKRHRIGIVNSLILGLTALRLTL
jgi:hypothetical protein